MWHQQQCQWCQWQKVILHLFLIALTWGMQWCQWWHHQHHMKLKPTPVASHDQKSNFAPHFSCLNILNAVISMMMLMASCDTDACVNSIKLPQSDVSPHFSCLDLRNVMMPLITPSASQDVRASPNGVTWQKVIINILITWPKDCNGNIDSAVHITWYWHQCSCIRWHQHQCQWYHVMLMMMSVVSHDKKKIQAFELMRVLKCYISTEQWLLTYFRQAFTRHTAYILQVWMMLLISVFITDLDVLVGTSDVLLM